MKDRIRKITDKQKIYTRICSETLTNLLPCFILLLYNCFTIRCKEHPNQAAERNDIMANSIASVDKNFEVKAQIKRDGLSFYNIDNAPFKIYGIFREGHKYRRIPEELAKRVSDGVHWLHANTAGGRVRFKTDSRTVSIIAKMENPGKMPHFALTGSAGFDLYTKEKNGYEYYKTFTPPFDIADGYESTLAFPEKELRDITINFPLYSDVCELLIGIEDGAILAEGDKYIDSAPMVYYGSSITQGGCASRAGSAYQGFISRRFDRDFINLGFSGSARAEDPMIEYIAGLDMSVYIHDYDYNAPSIEHLAATHEKMYKAIRMTHPDIPIVIMSRPQYVLKDEGPERVEIIRKTYENALAAGENVYMLDGRMLMEVAGTEGTVDDCHPTDLGFASMAKALGDLLERILY